jgi:hypothetical protein
VSLFLCHISPCRNMGMFAERHLGCDDATMLVT